MKRTISIACFLISLSFMSFTQKEDIIKPIQPSQLVITKYHLIRTYHFVRDIKANNGLCNIHIDATIDYSLGWGGVTINSIHGTVTTTGTCGSTITFRSVDGMAMYNFENRVESVDWGRTGDDVLNSEEFQNNLSEELNAWADSL